MTRLLIVGAGDVAQRLLPLLTARFRVFVLLRDAARADWWRQRGARPVLGDLDDRASLRRLRGLADWVVHLAPPPDRGHDDRRTRNLLASLALPLRARLPLRPAAGLLSYATAATTTVTARKGPSSLPQRLVYISTSGVYGDWGGARIDETTPCRPTSSRARRRVAAERYCRQYAVGGARVSILRVPGIYAADRLPLARLQAGTPALAAADDVYTNHIHADDLARATKAALLRGRTGRVYNVCDDSEMRMGEYFDAVADAFALPRPPRVSRQEAAGCLSAQQLSFMAESRRLSNRRLKQELGLRLCYPDVAAGLAAARGRDES